MERYVIHIFHRDPEDPKRIAGTVEGGWGKKRKGFIGRDSLWRILTARHQGTRRRQTMREGEPGLRVMSVTEIMKSMGEPGGDKFGE